MISGELLYEPTSGITLKTLDLQASRDIASEARDYVSIKRYIEGNRRCTVIHAFDRKIRSLLNGSEAREVVGNATLVDGWCDDPAERYYTRLRFQSAAFTAFFNPRSITARTTKDRKKATVTFKRRADVRGKWGTAKITIGTSLSIPHSQSWDGSYAVNETPYFDITYKEPISLDEAMRTSSALQFFFCLTETTLSGPPAITLWSQDHMRARSLTGAQLLMSQEWYRAAKGRHPLHRLFVLNSLGKESIAAIGRWLDLARTIEPLTSLVLAAAESQGVDLKFLFSIQAIEGLHRVLLKSKAISDTDFERGVQVLCEAIPTNIEATSREFFKQRIPQHNEPSLATRLKDLGAIVQTLLPSALPQFSKDRRKIVDMRNEFSHALDSEQNSFQDAGKRALKLRYFAELLRALFEFVVLQQIGLQPDRLADIYARNNRFTNLARLREETFSSPAPSSS